MVMVRYWFLFLRCLSGQEPANCPFRGRCSIGTVLLAFGTYACVTQNDGRALLPPPPPSAYQAAALASDARFAQISGTQAFSRSVYQEASGPANTKVEILDTVVAPRHSVQIPAGAGPVLIDLRSGTGTVEAGSKTSTLSLQTPVSVPAGVQFTIKNPGLLPLMLRLYKVTGQ